MKWKSEIDILAFWAHTHTKRHWPVSVVAGDDGMSEDDSVGFDDVSVAGFDAIIAVAGCVSVALVDSMSAL